ARGPARRSPSPTAERAPEPARAAALRLAARAELRKTLPDPLPHELFRRFLFVEAMSPVAERDLQAALVDSRRSRRSQMAVGLNALARANAPPLRKWLAE